jgi:hypothetical protein
MPEKRTAHLADTVPLLAEVRTVRYDQTSVASASKGADLRYSLESSVHAIRNTFALHKGTPNYGN